MILVVSYAADEHTRAVLDVLNRSSAEAVLLDLAEFPQRMSLALNYQALDIDFRLRLLDREIRLKECRAIWWRRPGSFNPHPAVRRASHVNFVYSESIEAFRGLWHALDAAWMNHPSCDEAAARKVLQLKVARDVGLEIPLTYIGNDPERVRAFISALGADRVVYKSFSATPTEWRETRLLGPAELDLLDSVEYAPVIFQEYIEASFDVRVTIIGGHVYSAAIHSQETTYKIDFRMDMSIAKVEEVSLPEAVTAGLRRLMTRLGLVYGAIDMRKTPEGHYVFLEINPAGQWLFVEERTGQPITEAVASQLIGMAERRSAK